ncbi:MAG TPA: helix-turn-helix domain-containing protein, partial [Clostridia bacterium]|nr:helix-turn-helix domain-containing protein [Clostridia bacterium]
TILDNNLILAANKKNYSVFISNYSINNLQNILSELFTSIQDQYDFSLFGVIGSPCKDYIEIPKHYKEAQSMFYYLDSQKKIGIHHYNPANLNFIIDSMSETHRENLNTKVFHMCNVSEVLEYKSFIIEYYKCNGSLKHLSQENFIHKNTVQYKIQKVLSKTGFDMRVTNNLFILYIASIT